MFVPGVPGKSESAWSPCVIGSPGCLSGGIYQQLVNVTGKQTPPLADMVVQGELCTASHLSIIPLVGPTTALTRPTEPRQVKRATNPVASRLPGNKSTNRGKEKLYVPVTCLKRTIVYGLDWMVVLVGVSYSYSAKNRDDRNVDDDVGYGDDDQ